MENNNKGKKAGSPDIERTPGSTQSPLSQPDPGSTRMAKGSNEKSTTGSQEMNRGGKENSSSTNRQVNRDRSGNSSFDSGKDTFSSVGSKGVLGALGAIAGGVLLFRGATGKWPFSGKDTHTTSHKLKSVDINTSVVIDRPREELYAYWRNLENLPNFMTHLSEVRELDEKRSTWTAKIPGGVGTVEWDAEIVRERTNHLLAWRSLPDAEIENAGEVRFEIAPNGKGTLVETTISYRPPAGEVGNYAAKLFNKAFEKTIKKDLKQFKKFMEKGGAKKRKSQPAV